MSENVADKPLFDKYTDALAEIKRLRGLVAALPKCCSCSGIIKPEQGGMCMPCVGESTSEQQTSTPKHATLITRDDGVQYIVTSDQPFRVFGFDDQAGHTYTVEQKS